MPASVMEEDPWLQSYLSTTDVAFNSRINSKSRFKPASQPAPPASKAAPIQGGPRKVHKKKYALNTLGRCGRQSLDFYATGAMTLPGEDRRRSWSFQEPPVHPEKKSANGVPVVGLPERVNAVREDTSKVELNAGHFVVEHTRSRDVVGVRENVTNPKKAILFNELEVVRQRIQEATTTVWVDDGDDDADEEEGPAREATKPTDSRKSMSFLSRKFWSKH